MGQPFQKYKTIRHYHNPGDCHELTFSCFHRIPLLANDPWRQLLAESIDKALDAHALRLSAFVFMPEHVHLLVWPIDPKEAKISDFLKTLKMSCSTKIKHQLIVALRASADLACEGPASADLACKGPALADFACQCHPEVGSDIPSVPLASEGPGVPLASEVCRWPADLLQRLTVIERPGKTAFRFWQEGPGYDRNLNNVETVKASIAYIHENPVKRKLCRRAVEWRWSSARYYYPEPESKGVISPRVTPLPADYLTA